MIVVCTRHCPHGLSCGEDNGEPPLEWHNAVDRDGRLHCWRDEHPDCVVLDPLPGLRLVPTLTVHPSAAFL